MFDLSIFGAKKVKNIKTLICALLFIVKIKKVIKVCAEIKYALNYK